MDKPGRSYTQKKSEGYNLQPFTFSTRASTQKKARLYPRAFHTLWSYASLLARKRTCSFPHCLLSSLKPASHQISEASSSNQVEKNSQPTVISHFFNPEGIMSHHVPDSDQRIPWFQYWFHKHCPERLPGNRLKLHQTYLHSSTVTENPSCITQKRAKCNRENASFHVVWGCLTP